MELYNDKILMVIVTYNPELKFLYNNLKKFEGTDVLIIDNNSRNISEITDLVSNSKYYNLIENNANVGIAEALNQGLSYAHDKGYSYILTMDQDSSFKNDFLILKEGFSFLENVAIVSPSIIDYNSNNKDFAKEKFEEVFMAITSGCLCDVKSLLDVGGFNSSLFIDYVDFEICLKLQQKKYKILKSRDVVLNHSLGFSKVYKIWGIKFISTNHNELRRYYNARNRMYLAKKYFFIFPKFVIHNQLSFLKTILIIFLFENEKNKKIRSIFKGIKDGIKMK